jgi:hypothetical protein
MLELMWYRQSPEEELLDEIIQTILWIDKEEWWSMTYAEARTVARDSMEYGKALTAMKMRKVLASLWDVAYKNLSSQSIVILEDNTRNDDEMVNLIQIALMIMLRRYRSQFTRLMRQWWVDPKPYIEAYIDAKN